VWTAALATAVGGCATTNDPARVAPRPFQEPPAPEMKPPQALVGLPGVHLYVYLPDHLLALDLRVEPIEAEVRKRLAQWGIRELSHDEMLAVPGMPSLDVNINGVVDATGENVLFNVRVSLSEKMRLLRSPRAIVNTRMWDAATVGQAPLDRPDEVYSAAYETVDLFISDYLAANGRPAQIAAPSGRTRPAPTLLATQTSPQKQAGF
jgi:hypothetical protein